jgi:cysteine-S-conjugate beta-lyase
MSDSRLRPAATHATPLVTTAHRALWQHAAPTSVPIMQTATFAQSSAIGFDDFDYSRSGNPTRAVLEAELARLEHGARGFAFASGMAAIAASLSCLQAGDCLLIGDDLYGGAVRYIERVIAPRGVDVRTVHTQIDAGIACPWHVALRAARHALAPGARIAIYLETPTNPLLQVTDLDAVVQAAREFDAAVIVDNTTLSPHFQNPLDWGVDAVVHSATKHLGGHGDLTAGAIVVGDTLWGAHLGEQVAFIQNAEGSALGPFDAWLLIRGMKTLEVRLERESATAQLVAEWLIKQPGVEHVFYPGLESHPGHAVMRRQARGFGALLSFTTGDAEASKRIVEGVRRFTIAVSFGNTSSSISLPCAMSHASVPAESQRARPPQDLVRLSIGLEPPDELIADLAAALETCEWDSPNKRRAVSAT